MPEQFGWSFPVAEPEHVDPVVDDSVAAGAGVKKRFMAFEPAAVMLVRVLLHGYCVGVRLSRESE